MILSDRKTGFIERIVLPFIHVVTPFLFFSILTGISGTIFGALSVNAVFYLLLLLVGVEEMIVGRLLFQLREAREHRWRECVLLLIFAYTGFAFFRDGPFLQRFMPDIPLFYKTTLIGLMWFSSSRFHKDFRMWNLFVRNRSMVLIESDQADCIKNKHIRQRTVRSLSEFMRNEGHFLREVQSCIRGVMTRSALFLLTVTTYLFILPLLGYEIHRYWEFLYISFFFLVMVIQLIARRFFEEIRVSGEGLLFSGKEKKAWLLFGIFILGVILFVGQLIVLRFPLVPISVFLDFFTWLSSFFNGKTIPADFPVLPKIPPPPRFSGIEEIVGNIESSSSFFWRQFWRILAKWLLIAGIIGGSILLFGPLFSRKLWKYIRDGAKKIILKAKLSAKELMRFLIRFLCPPWRLLQWGQRSLKQLWVKVYRMKRRKRWRLFSTNEEEERYGEKNSLRQSPRFRFSALRAWFFGDEEYLRNETASIARGLKRIMKWGQRRGISYRPSETLEEYFTRIAEGIADQEAEKPTEELIRRFAFIRCVYQASRFSTEGVGAVLRRQYKLSIKEILSR